MAAYTTTNQPLPYVQPYLQDYLARSQEVMNQPYTQGPGTYTGPNAALQQGWQTTANRAMQGSPVMGAANTQLQNTINGGYLNANPYLDQNIANAQGDLTKAWNTVQQPAWDKAMSASGSFGNSGVMEANANAQGQLQQNLGRIGSDMRGNAYTQERTNQMNALGMAPNFANQDYVDSNALLNVGQQQQTFDQAAQNQNNAYYQAAQQYPIDRLNIMGNALGIGGQGNTQTQTQSDPSAAGSALGGAMVGSQLGDVFGIGSGWGAGLGGLLGLFGG